MNPEIQRPTPAAVQPGSLLSGSDIVWDEVGFRDRFGEDAELWRMILEAFFEDVPKRIDRLREASKMGDGQEVGRLAHHIKGSTATVSAQSMTRLAKQIEEHALAGELEKVCGLTSMLEQGVESFRQVVATRAIPS